MPHSELAEIKKLVEHLIDMEFLRLSKSSRASPVLFAIEKDESLRFCVDLRALNRLTVKNSYPLSRIDTTMDRIGTAQYFPTIDLRDEYHQIRIAEKNISNTAFSTRNGRYEYITFPFGSTNAPAAFQSIMNDVFKDCTDSFVMVYYDGVLVYCKS